MRVRTRSARSLRPALRLIATALALAGLASPAVANDAEVVSLTGKGDARESGSGDWRPAMVKQKLKGGAFVRTGDSSTMALLMSDQTQLRLNQNSMLQIKESAAGAPTRLELKGGRAWMNSKAKAGNVVIDTPNATAAIRGTEWELEVDPSGKTMLAVLSGTVEFSNPQGSVTVGRNEGAFAELGKAPVKVVLVNPKDRVQWVNAYTIDPRRYAEAAKGAPAVRSALDAIAQGDLAGARRELNAEKARGTRTPAVYGLLADMDLVAGETARALATLGEGLAANPRDPELLGQLATTQLVADKADEARKTVAQPRSAETAGILVAEGEVARRDGDIPKTFTAFTRATTAAPADDRGWFALGRAQNEREDTTPARASLAKAIALNPAGAGYQGELGTLETFANRFGEAKAAFDKALAANPADYVALTGQGLARLKQGDAEGGLDSLLRAGVLEPRYARARTYTAVAYYQLGRHADAIATFKDAAALDDKDPLPYLFLTQVYTDLFRAGDAVDASREALKRLPYLKSLNQVANNQQGTTNLGYSLAFFGLESWALEIAQQSYSPYLASSHLFLADRYSGAYTRHPELLQRLSAFCRGGAYKLVSNLPYNVASPLLIELWKHRPPSVGSVLVQREVGERIAAIPGGPDVGVLSVQMQWRAETALVRKVSAGSFWPPPRVESAVVKLVTRAQPLYEQDDPAAAESLLKIEFQHRRKTLANALKDALPTETVERAGALSIVVGEFDGNRRRPEALAPMEWVTLARRLARRS